MPTISSSVPAVGAAATIAWLAGSPADFYPAPYRGKGWNHINVRATVGVEPHRAEFGFAGIKADLLAEVGTLNGPSSVAARVITWLDVEIAAEALR